MYDFCNDTYTTYDEYDTFYTLGEYETLSDPFDVSYGSYECGFSDDWSLGDYECGCDYDWDDL